MRSAGAGLIAAAILALAGCKSTDPKANDKTPGTGIGRPKADGKDAKGTPAKGPTWLDDVNRMPGAGIGIPKGAAATNPKDPHFDPKTAAQGVIGGRVTDPFGQPARNVFVRIEPVGGAGPGDNMGIYTDNNGYFETNGLKPGASYELSVSVNTQDGKTLSGSVQTRAPAVTLAIQLRDDLPPRAGGPAPAPKGTDFIPPGGFAPVTPPKPAGDAWTPNGPTTGTPPATLGGPPPSAPSPGTSGAAAPGPVPPPDDLNPSIAPRPVRPENVADDSKSPFKPPAASIPNPSGPPPVPPLPKLPPTFTPPAGGKSSMDTGTGRLVGKFTLLDTQERPWESTAVQPGGLVLVEFMISNDGPCQKAVPVLKDLQSRYGAAGLQVIGVLCDDLSQRERAAAAAQLRQAQNLNYAVYVEPVKAGSVRDRFDVERYPHAVLLDASGRTLWRGNPLDRDNLEAAVKAGLVK